MLLILAARDIFWFPHAIPIMFIHIYYDNIFYLVGFIAIGCDVAYSRDSASSVHASLGPITSPV